MENLRELTPRFHEGQSILDGAMLRSDSVARKQVEPPRAKSMLEHRGGIVFLMIR